jgi:hypothetical protein
MRGEYVMFPKGIDEFYNRNADRLDPHSMVRNPNLTLKFITDHPNSAWKMLEADLFEQPFMSNQKPQTTMERFYADRNPVNNFIHKKSRQSINNSASDFNNWAIRSDISIKEILEEPKANIYFFCALNPNVNMGLIIDNPQFPWEWDGLCKHPNIRPEWVIDFAPKEVSFHAFSENPNTTLALVLKYPDQVWNWPYLCSNMNLSMDDIRTHLELPWDFNYLSRNYHFHWLEIEETKNEFSWNWKNISLNKFFME